MDGGGLAQFRTKQRSPHGALGGVDIVLEQRGGDIQSVADVIESEGGRIRREVVGRTKVDPEQIANGVVIFSAVEPARGHTSRLRLHLRVLAGEFGFKPPRDGAYAGFRRTRSSG